MKKADKLRATIETLESAGSLSYEDHLEFSRAAGDEEDWELALDQVEKALPLITPENVLRRYHTATAVRDEKLSEDFKRVFHTALLMKGWSMYQLGRKRDGLEIFDRVEKEGSYSYLGIPESALNLFRGQVLLNEHDYEGALKRLAPGALIAARPMEEALFRTAYLELHADMSGYENYCDRLRKDIAPTMDDFSATDYTGNPFSFSSIAGKVVFLFFWFPACAGCQDKLPVLERAWRRYGTDGFHVITLDAHSDHKGAATIRDKYDLTFTMLVNGSGEDELVGKLFRIRVFPVGFIIDRQGRIMHAYDWQHDLDAELLDNRIRKLLPV